MQYSSVLVCSMLQCSGGDGGGRGGVDVGVRLLGTLLFGMIEASLIFIDDFGYWGDVLLQCKGAVQSDWWSFVIDVSRAGITNTMLLCGDVQWRFLTVALFQKRFPWVVSCSLLCCYCSGVSYAGEFQSTKFFCVGLPHASVEVMRLVAG